MASRSKLKLFFNRDRMTSLGVLIASGLITCGSINIEVGTFRNPGMGLFPLLLGLTMGALGIILFLQSRKKEVDGTSGAFFTKDVRYAIFVMISILIFPIALEILGFPISIFLILLFTLRLMEPIKWLKVFLIIGMCEVFIIFLFVYLLRIRIPTGIFGF